MNQESAIAIIRASGLADRLDRIVPHLALGLRIRTTRSSEAEKGFVSRFAGNGVLPRGTSWPTWDSSALNRRWIRFCEQKLAHGRGSAQMWRAKIVRYEAAIRENPKPIHFLAMVRLRDVAPYTQVLGLPDRGVLLFFYDMERNQGSFWPEARGGWAILHAESEEDVVLVDDPPVHGNELLASTLSFEVQYSLPEDIRAATGDDDLRIYGNPEFARVHTELLGGEEDATIIHQLGGVPQEVQSGLFLHSQLAANGLDCGDPEDYRHPRAMDLAPGAEDWRLVLQIDSDERGPGWMWGDVGRLYYCLHRDDLVARRFDRAWCTEQCG